MSFSQRYPAYLTPETAARLLQASKALHAKISQKRQARAITEAIRASVSVVPLRGR
jgi:hypothetical protein